MKGPRTPLIEGMQGERRATGTFPRISEKGGREEADSGSDGGQEQIQKEKWMVCPVHGVISLSHSRNDQAITAHCLMQAYFKKIINNRMKGCLQLSFSCTSTCLWHIDVVHH